MSSSENPTVFEEEQTFRQTWIWALLVGIAVFLLAFFGYVLVRMPQAAAGLIVPGIIEGVLLVAVASLLYSMRLSVRLDSEALHVRFFPFLKRNIPLSEIAQWEIRTYRPLIEYGGWGIRWSLIGRGKAYNVSGNQGLQLKFTNGKRLLIGTQRPAELGQAMEQVAGPQASPSVPAG